MSLLSDEDKAKYQQEVIADAIGDAKPAAKRKAILMAGQPGAGKTTPTKLAMKQFEESGEGAALINPDNARDLHPLYKELMAADDMTAADIVHPEASEAAKVARAAAIEAGLNVVIDGTLSNPESAMKLVEELVAAGYEVEVVGLCVDPAVSWAGVLKRQAEERAKKGSGRSVPKDFHDAAAAAIPNSLEALRDQGLVSKLEVVTREGQKLLECSPAEEAASGDKKPGEITKVFEENRGQDKPAKAKPPAPPPPAAPGGGGGGGGGGGKPQSRIGDMHVCPMVTGIVPHVGGPISIGCPTVLVGGAPAARVGDMCVCVGPPDVIAFGSTTVLIGGQPAARIGDMTAHGGSIVIGLPTVLTGG